MIVIRAMFVRLSLMDDGSLLVELQVKPTLANEIKVKYDKLKIIGLIVMNILREVHNSSYVMHTRRNKMYRDLKELYWWPKLKRDVVDLVAKCLMCQ
ncbi:zinc finger and BTB domain-containing protein 11-like [Gossypium australe]|uniref:Zinc finger and BTB domain-containing protein 11-like n=1 Tax=Gossypium australe TaxID=47621 RepID=A0A5B6WE02_9ROSI|nr:zinc finger and BTB domain-containing protein 11-like [Gossypium australe]